MQISEQYVICEMMDEVYLIPEEWDKKDLSTLQHMKGSAGTIISQISKNKGITLCALQDLICDLYEAEESERISIRTNIEQFITKCEENGIIILS